MTMRALLSGPDSLVIGEAPMPEPAGAEVRIRVRAVGINYPDLLIIEDKYQYKPQRPFAPGAEVSGVVDALGPDAHGFSLGDRVMAMAGWGGLAEYVCVPAAKCSPCPPDMPFDEAAAFLMTYGTSYHALKHRARLAAGETLLVLGAAGGVGLAAVVYDPVGGTYAEPALRAIAWEGRYLVVGFPAGIPAIPLNLPLLKSCDICGVFWGASIERDPEGHRKAVSELVGLYQASRIRPRIHARFGFAQAADAIALLATRGVAGKVVVTMD
jgi:NADPH2:quinone reductase